MWINAWIFVGMGSIKVKQCSLFFFDGKQCSVLCWGRKLLYAVVPLRKPGLDELKRLKIGSKWGLYEVKMSCLRACEGAFETNNPAWCRQSGPKAVCHSSDQAFWGPFGPHFGRFLRHTRHWKMKSVLGVLLGAKFDQNLMNLGSKLEPSEDDTWP